MRCRARFFFSSRRRHTSLQGDWSSDVCSSDLADATIGRRLDSLELAFSPDGRWIAVGGAGGGTVTLVDRATEIGRASCRERGEGGGGGGAVAGESGTTR